MNLAYLVFVIVLYVFIFSGDLGNLVSKEIDSESLLSFRDFYVINVPIFLVSAYFFFYFIEKFFANSLFFSKMQSRYHSILISKKFWLLNSVIFVCTFMVSYFWK
jgi:hypothetical protein